MEARIQALHHLVIIKVPSTLHPNKPCMITPASKTKKKNIHISKAQGRGAPMASSVALLYLMEFLNENKLWAVPLWLPFLTVLLGFGTSAMGIAYGSLSTSWDPEREGSLLGWQEAQKNWPELWKDEDERQRR
ncbi:hypothetical protein DsansV1_C05g0057081 [Dioscorea sansibarensis]